MTSLHQLVHVAEGLWLGVDFTNVLEDGVRVAFGGMETVFRQAA